MDSLLFRHLLLCEPFCCFFCDDDGLFMSYRFLALNSLLWRIICLSIRDTVLTCVEFNFIGVDEMVYRSLCALYIKVF